MSSARRCLGLIGLVGITAACSSGDDEPSPSGWQPGIVYPTERAPSARGLLDRRGLVHAHSVYSHDACDGAPRDAADAINAPCLEDFRRGLCSTQHDFVMLSDHNESFSRTEYPDTLLYDAARGDQLVERGGGPVANFLACPDGHEPLVMAGTETKTMPVGLERHVAATESERSDYYGKATAEAILKFKEMGAVALVAHTEDWTVQELVSLPLDGFEMYNLHANTILGAGAVLSLLADLKTPEELPHPDLVMLPLFSEDTRYLSTWGSVLASGAKRVTTLGTDCHQNTLREELPDGERIDSYRRMMGWFSNHVLISPNADGTYDDVALKQALQSGRAYGVFEVLGFPVGFDFFATRQGETHEMGESVDATDAPELHVVAPTLEKLDPSVTPPELTLRVLKAKAGGFDVVAEGTGELAHTAVEPGAYRAEVRVKPRHLERYLSNYRALSEKDFVWIYSNPIYVE